MYRIFGWVTKFCQNHYDKICPQEIWTLTEAKAVLFLSSIVFSGTILTVGATRILSAIRQCHLGRPCRYGCGTHILFCGRCIPKPAWRVPLAQHATSIVSLYAHILDSVQFLNSIMLFWWGTAVAFNMWEYTEWCHYVHRKYLSETFLCKLIYSRCNTYFFQPLNNLNSTEGYCMCPCSKQN